MILWEYIDTIFKHAHTYPAKAEVPIKPHLRQQFVIVPLVYYLTDDDEDDHDPGLFHPSHSLGGKKYRLRIFFFKNVHILESNRCRLM